jgi:hypothetical protein
MENIKHCAVVVRNAEDLWEATRTTLGLLIGNYWTYLFVLDLNIEMTEALQENFDWLEEMECLCFTNRKKNKSFGFSHLPTGKLVRELKKMDLIIPFGDRK